MTPEIYNLAVPGRLFVFIAAKNTYRAEALDDAVQGLGATPAGPNAFWLGKDQTSPEAIRDALGSLEDGECVYVIGGAGDALESHLIVAPKVELR